VGTLWVQNCGSLFKPFSKASNFDLSIFLRNWALVVLYLCASFRIFDRFVLKEFVFQFERAHTCFNHVDV
jgi:hypothetical protein